VEAYSDMGNHRVGTDVDRQTNAWFADELKEIGGNIELQPFSFDYYDNTSTVTIDGKEVPSAALYYEGVGTLDSDEPYVAAAVATTGDRTSKALEAEIAKANAAGAKIAVIATTNPVGKLQVPNRYPKLGSGMPVVMVPGRYGDALKSGKVHVSFSGRITSGHSENVLARFGDTSGKPIVIATPLPAGSPVPSSTPPALPSPSPWRNASRLSTRCWSLARRDTKYCTTSGLRPS
jgi:hypothetical protein